MMMLDDHRIGKTLDGQLMQPTCDAIYMLLKCERDPQAAQAHAAAEAAHRQGKFWEMHDRIFANQRDLAVATLESHARAIGLDMDRYGRDVADASIKQRIDEDMEQAQELNVTGTPAFFINGRFLSGAQPFENFKRAIDAAIERAS